MDPRCRPARFANDHTNARLESNPAPADSTHVALDNVPDMFGAAVSASFSREEHPVTTIVLHWAHLLAFFYLVYTGIQIHALPAGSEVPAALDQQHMLGWVIFLASTFWRLVWAFMGDGSATHGSHEIEEDWHHFSFRRGDLKLAGKWLVAYLTFKRNAELPQNTKYNPLQRIVYSIAFPVIVAACAATGLALWPTTEALFAGFTGFLGGEESVRQAHYAIMIAMLVLTGMHVYAAAFAGLSRLTAMLFRWAPARERA